MITRIYARGFKGMDFDQPLDRHTVFTGRVGSGKSSRCLALSLVVTGALPGTGVARNNADILNTIGRGDTLVVGLQLDNETTLERAYKRKKNGVVGCEYRLNGEICPKNLFEMEIDKQGIQIADVPSFLALSDAKKIDELFRLFPPAGDARKLTAAIAAAKERISTLEGDIKGKEQASQSIAGTIADMNLPAGALPEVQADIARLEREHQAARDAMVQEIARIEHEARLSSTPPVAETKQCTLMESITPPRADQNPATPQTFTQPPSPPCQNLHMAALERVLSALERAGCASCAAKLVLRREIRAVQAVQE